MPAPPHALQHRPKEKKTYLPGLFRFTTSRAGWGTIQGLEVCVQASESLVGCINVHADGKMDCSLGLFNPTQEEQRKKITNAHTLLSLEIKGNCCIFNLLTSTMKDWYRYIITFSGTIYRQCFVNYCYNNKSNSQLFCLYLTCSSTEVHYQLIWHNMSNQDVINHLKVFQSVKWGES